MFFSKLLESNASSPLKKIIESPQIIQLYSEIRIDFQRCSIIHPSSSSGQMTTTPLSYDIIDYPNASYGIWNCPIEKPCSSQLFHKVLFSAPNKKTIFLLTLDLSQETQVFSCLSQMQQIITEYLSSNSDIDPCLLHRIQKVPFGSTDTAILEQETTDNKSNIAIILCAILPTTPPKQYRDQQAQNLFKYHLLKFAHQLNGTLAFLQKEDSEDVEEKTEEGMTISSLKRYIFQSLVDPDDPIMEEQDENSVNSPSPSFYTPNSYDEDVIHGIVLRNASCEGHWDASTDSLQNVFPPESKRPKKSSTVKVLITEQEWLEKLASTVKTTAATRAASTATPAVDANKPSNDNLGSFFQSLMHK